MKKLASILAAVLMLGLMIVPVASAATIKAQLPVIFVSAGQSGGVYVTDALCVRAGIPADWSDAPTGDQLASGVGLPAYNANDPKVLPVQIDVKSTAAKGTPYKTIVFVMGASLKGMGASGLTVDTEVARIQSNIDWAKKNNVTIIGMHVEGKSLRGKPGSDNETIIDAVLPSCQMIIATEGSDHDGKFTDYAAANNIPCEVVKNTTALVPVLQAIFQ